MRLSDFEAIKEHIALNNSYFATGYANVVRDATLNAVVTANKDKIFPSDKYGAYFYLRNETAMNFTAKPNERLSDCGTMMPYDETMVVYLVAVVNDADPYILLENLRNTLVAYKGASITFSNANWNREDITRTEMQGSAAEDIAAALGRLKKQTIVRLTMTVAMSYVPSKCETVNPCVPCSATV